MTANQEPLKAPIPESVVVEHGPNGLVCTYNWFSWKFIALAVFALFWDGFLVFWYSIAFSQDAPWIMFAFPLIHVSVGAGLTYYALAGFYNKTIVTVGMGRLSIRHTPFPWPGSQTVQASDLLQLYSEEQLTRSNNGTRITYQLSAISNQNRKIRLLRGLNSPDEVRFFERQIEEQLGIQDRPVDGEMRR
ncbi:MAG: hypothetical protein NTU47_11770 [Ignavibacteriales bacterium]|nr:hypothetical protein [Ignavibacteriales bacterium]